jgi:hypothetical protein
MHDGSLLISLTTAAPPLSTEAKDNITIKSRLIRKMKNCQFTSTTSALCFLMIMPAVLALLEHSQQIRTAASTATSTTERDLRTRTTCTMEGHTVYLSELCCEDTVRVQNNLNLGNSVLNETCDSEIDISGFFANMGQYCNITSPNNVTCTYDYWNDDRPCAQQKKDACVAASGQYFFTETTVECPGTSAQHPVAFTLTVKNEIDCLGSHCHDHDRRAFDMMSAENANRKYGDCKVIKINGQSLEEMEREDFISGLIATVIVGVIFLAFLRMLHNRKMQRRMRMMAQANNSHSGLQLQTIVRNPTGHQPIAVAQPVTAMSNFDAEFT